MKYRNITILLCCLFIFSLNGCYEPLDKKIVFFENMDVTSGNYKLLVYGTEGEWIEDYQDFYIDDIKTLKKMKRQWVFTKKSDVMPCGYGYAIYLVNQTEILKKTYVNIDCEYMSGWVRFPSYYLSAHKKSFKRMTEEDKARFSERYFKKD